MDGQEEVGCSDQCPPQCYPFAHLVPPSCPPSSRAFFSNGPHPVPTRLQEPLLEFWSWQISPSRSLRQSQSPWASVSQL